MRRLTVAAPSYLARHGVPEHPKDLLSHNCIRYQRGGVMEWAYLVNGKPLSVAVGGNLTVNQVAVGAKACLAGLGVGTFFAYQVAPDIRSGALRPVLQSFETAPRPIHILYPGARLLPARTRAFIELMQAHLAAEQASWHVEVADAAGKGGARRKKAAKPRR